MTDNGQPPQAQSGEDLPPGGSASPGKLVLLIVLGGVLAIVAVRQLFTGQRIPPLTEAALDQALQRWTERGPNSYDADFEIRGNQPGVVHVEVRAGEVVAMQRDGTAPSQPRTWKYWSIPARFDEIERELELAADPEHEMRAAADTRLELRCEFDARYGFPRVFHRIVYGGGPEVYWRVTAFLPK